MNVSDGSLESAVVVDLGIKLLGFYQHGLWGSHTSAQPMLSDRAVAVSQALRNMPSNPV